MVSSELEYFDGPTQITVPTCQKGRSIFQTIVISYTHGCEYEHNQLEKESCSRKSATCLQASSYIIDVLTALERTEIGNQQKVGRCTVYDRTKSQKTDDDLSSSNQARTTCNGAKPWQIATLWSSETVFEKPQARK